MSLNQNIARARKKLGLTQEQLAEKCNVSRQAVTKWESGECEPAIAKLELLSNIFDVSIDELVTGREIKCADNSYEREINKHMSLLTMMASDLTAEHVSVQDESWRLIMLAELYEVIKMRYVDAKGEVRQQYLIDNTSVNERTKIVKLLMTERIFAKNLFQEYIDGKKEIGVIFSTLIDCIEKKQTVASKNLEKKQDSIMAQNYYSIHGLVQAMRSLGEYSDSKIQEISQELQDIMDSQVNDTYIGRFLIFYLKNVQEAWNDKELRKLEELDNDWSKLQSYIWSKIEV